MRVQETGGSLTHHLNDRSGGEHALLFLDLCETVHVFWVQINVVVCQSLPSFPRSLAVKLFPPS